MLARPRSIAMRRGATIATEPDRRPLSAWRVAHQPLEALRSGQMGSRVSWVLDVDVQYFFDTLDHQQCQEMLRKRVSDGVSCRLVDKWLNAGYSIAV